jgi:hypothetical protein
VSIVDVSAALHLALRISCGGVIVDVAEHGSARDQFRDDGSYSWRIVRQRLAGRGRWQRWLADAVFGSPSSFAVLLALRLVAAVGVLVSPMASRPYGAALSLLLVTQLGLWIRRGGLGLFGADKMLLVVGGAAWLATVVAHDEVATRAAVWFIAAQAALAYFVSGFFKLLAASWRSGRALQSVLETQALGSQALSRLLVARPALARVLCWTVILWECLFPLVLLLPGWLKLPVLGAGLLFHVSIAIVMGLNQFVWAFAATYPALWLSGI